MQPRLLSTAYRNLMILAFLLASCLFSPAILAAKYQNYEVLKGDVNSDGNGADLYFSSKKIFLLIGGKIPMYVPGPPPYALYFNTATKKYGAPVPLTLTDAQISSLGLTTASPNSDYFVVPDLDGNGRQDLVIQGSSDPLDSIVLLAVYNQFPNVATIPANGVLTLASGAVTVADYNGDGRKDLYIERFGNFSSGNYSIAYADASGHFQYLQSVGSPLVPTDTVYPTYVDIPQPPVLAEVPDLPTSSAQVGSINSQMDVDANGGATWSTQLILPRGIGGFQPTVSLSYTSLSGNGVLGVGWSLGATSNISRCRRFYEQDGYYQEIRFTTEDALCLDSQRLIPVTAAHLTDNAEYRPQFDSATKVIFHSNGNGGYFEIHKPNGEKEYYGETADSITADVAGGTVYRWLLNKKKDTYGNTIDYSYTGDNQHERQLDVITYSGNTVDFQYASRSDASKYFFQGNGIVDDQFLTDIVISNHNDSIISSYHFHHELSSTSGRNLLKTIRRCDGSEEGTCLPPTSFHYEDSIDLGLRPVSEEIVIHLSDFMNVGDSKASNYCDTNFQVPEVHCSGKDLQVMDSNGDGVPELLVVNSVGTHYQYRTLNITGDGYSLGNISGTGDLFRQSFDIGGGYQYGYSVQAIVYDTNGDGVDEIVFGSNFPSSSEAPPLRADLNGDGIAEPAGNFSQAAENYAKNMSNFPGRENCPNNANFSFKVKGQAVDVFDYNGDGLVDRLYRVTGYCVDAWTETWGYIGEQYLILKNTTVGSTHTEEPIPVSDVEVGSFTLRGDINGDGFLDIKGTGCATGIDFTDCFDAFNIPGLSVSGSRLRQLIDVNGDGRDDQVYLDKSNGKLLATLSGFGAASPHTLELGQVGWANIPNKSASYLWIDLDGDGLPALVYFDQGNHTIHILHDANFQNKPVDMMTSVDNGMGLTSDFDYVSLAYSDRYTRYTDASTLAWGNSPVFDSKGSLFVVERFTHDSAVDGDGTTLSKALEYHYEGLRYQAGGRGSLGFAKVIQEDTGTNQVTTMTYRQQFPFTGQMSGQRRKVLTSSATYATLYDMSVTQWQNATFLTGQVHHVEPKQIQEKHYTLSGSSGVVGSVSTPLNTTVTTKAWTTHSENYTQLESITATRTDHKTGDVLSVVTNYDYTNEDTTNWRIQRPTDISTTRTLTYADASTDVKTQFKTLSYNSAGRLATEETGSSSQTAQYVKTAYQYDGFGNTVSVTQCSSHYATNCATRPVPTDTDSDQFKFFRRAITQYDTAGRFITSTSNGLFTTATYENYTELGQPGKITDANQLSQEFSYDPFGRQYFSRSDDGSYVQTLLGMCSTDCPDNARYFVETTSPNAPDSQLFYDIAGREVGRRTKTLTGGWTQILSEYDKNGRLVSQSQPHFIDAITVYSAGFLYDDMGRKWKEEVADGTTKEMSWSGYTETISVTSTYISSYEATPVSTAAVAQTSKKTINGFGQLVVSEDANNQETRYRYGALGSLVQATNLDGSVVSVGFDDYGRKISLDDPDKGHITYTYNGLGEIVRRTAPGNIHQISYFDAVGRKVRMETTATEGNHTGTFVYSGPLLDTETSSEGVERTFDYDEWGRIHQVTHRIGAENTWTTSTIYDQYGRVFQQFDPSGDFRGIQYSYQNGYTANLKEAQNSDQVYYTATDMDAFGHVTGWTLGNGHTGSAVYDSQTGFVQRIYNSDGFQAIEDQLYEYDGMGNLRARTDRSDGLASNELQEIFDYDDLNRLTTVTLNDVGTLSVTYNDNGNIRTKSDIEGGALYAYGTQNSQCSVNPGTHALTGIGSRYRYCYDLRGNQTHTYLDGSVSRQVNYTGYDKPSSIQSGQAQSRFYYDARYRRFKREDSDSNGNRTTYYIDGHEVLIHDSGLVEYKRYIGDVAIDIVRSDDSQATHYLYRDHIGSVVAIADSNGNVERLSYDAFGKRRAGLSWQALQDVVADATVQAALAVTQRGFTRHEHVDHADIIHMGGRLYDPTTGRFVQADPIVQAPENGQSLNRYTYVFNNPLSYTDPTGYTAKTICEQADKNGGLEVRCVTVEDEQRKEFKQRAVQLRQRGLARGPISWIVDALALRQGIISGQAFTIRGAGLGESESSKIGNGIAASLGAIERFSTDLLNTVTNGHEVFNTLLLHTVMGTLGGTVVDGVKAEGTAALGAAANGEAYEFGYYASGIVGTLLLRRGWEAAKGGKVHKNSLDYVGETHVYRVKGPDGSTYKIGESARGTRMSDGASIRAEQQARRLTRETGDTYTSEIRKTFPDKASARDYETRVIERFRRMHGQDTLPGNKTNR